MKANADDKCQGCGGYDDNVFVIIELHTVILSTMPPHLRLCINNELRSNPQLLMKN
jgi:hypothetical protein